MVVVTEGVRSCRTNGGGVVKSILSCRSRTPAVSDNDDDTVPMNAAASTGS